MTAKEYLRQLYVLDMEITNKQEELEELNTKTCSPLSQQLSDMPKAHGHSEDKIGNAVAKMIVLQSYINKRIDTLIDLRQTITKQIDGMTEPIHRVILTERYIKHKDWLTIADDIGYSIQRTYELHGIALMEFDNKYLK